jgi:hypothetical protein
MAGWVFSFSPRPAPHLELGIGRFYHTPWPAGGLTIHNFLKPFQPFLKASVDSTGYGQDLHGDPDDQLASVFARWVLPRAGFEAYGEFLRDDHNWDLQDALLEPDHQSAYMLGLQKLWTRGGGLLVLRGEVMNARRSTLAHVRAQNLTYSSFPTPQGHTLRGQVLGAPDAYGGSGSTVALDGYTRRGRWWVRWDRAERGELADSAGAGVASRVDATNALGVERVLFVRGAELTGGVRGVWELNRGYGGDAFNLNATLGFRARF